MRPELRAATLAGIKTVTRRPMKVQPQIGLAGGRKEDWEYHGAGRYCRFVTSVGGAIAEYLKCPYGGKGDRLYIKEPFRIDAVLSPQMVRVVYSDGMSLNWKLTDDEWEKYQLWQAPDFVKSSLFMFKSLARTWMEVTDITGQRIQDISNDDAMREGVRALLKVDDDAAKSQYLSADYITPFRELWDELNAPRGNGWADNKYQWVIRYKLLVP